MLARDGGAGVEVQEMVETPMEGLEGRFKALGLYPMSQGRPLKDFE